MLQAYANAETASPVVSAPTARHVTAGTICLLLIVLTIAAYYRVATFDFVPVDDGKYVYDHPRIKQGLTVENVRWAFTTGYFAIWHPLTWCSYLLDGQLFHAAPRLMHAENLLLHLLNTLLLFAVLRRMTGDLGPSAFVAAIFALHPLQVEPVAWISSRKDVLYAMSWMLTLGAYARYVERPSWWRYLAVAFGLTLGLLSKASMVTLPCVLLLLDVWPLRRYDACGMHWLRRGLKLAIEKLPLFALSATAALFQHLAAQQGGLLGGNLVMSPVMRVAQAATNYVAYLGKAFWPTDLELFYKHPATLTAAELPDWYRHAAVAGVAIFILTAAVLRLSSRHRYLAVGWLWFVGTLVPVIGLIQVGSHTRADRYTYVPLIGLAIMVAWGVPELLRKLSGRAAWSALLGTAVVAACLALSWRQVGCWQNGVTLGRHLVAVDEQNYQAHGILAFALGYAGREDESLSHTLRSLELAPPKSQFVQSMHNHAGIVLTVRKKFAEAEEHLRAALALNPAYGLAHLSLGRVLALKGDTSAAESEFNETLRLEPRNAGAHYELGLLRRKQQRPDEAERHFAAAVKLDPSYAAIIAKPSKQPDAE
jgi:tetratricopeptide (TPR) repeat protein